MGVGNTSLFTFGTDTVPNSTTLCEWYNHATGHERCMLIGGGMNSFLTEQSVPCPELGQGNVIGCVQGAGTLPELCWLVPCSAAGEGVTIAPVLEFTELHWWSAELGEALPLDGISKKIDGGCWVLLSADACCVFWQELDILDYGNWLPAELSPWLHVQRGTPVFPGCWRKLESRAHVLLGRGDLRSTTADRLVLPMATAEHLCSAICLRNAASLRRYGTTGNVAHISRQGCWAWVRAMWHLKLSIVAAIVGFGMFLHHIRNGPVTRIFGDFQVGVSLIIATLQAWSFKQLADYGKWSMLQVMVWRYGQPLYPGITEWYGCDISVLAWLARSPERWRKSPSMEIVHLVTLSFPFSVGVAFLFMGPDKDCIYAFPLWVQIWLVVESTMLWWFAIFFGVAAFFTPSPVELSLETIQCYAEQLNRSLFIGCSRRGSGARYRTGMFFHIIRCSGKVHVDVCRGWSSSEKPKYTDVVGGRSRSDHGASKNVAPRLADDTTLHEGGDSMTGPLQLTRATYKEYIAASLDYAAWAGRITLQMASWVNKHIEFDGRFLKRPRKSSPVQQVCVACLTDVAECGLQAYLCSPTVRRALRDRETVYKDEARTTLAVVIPAGCGKTSLGRKLLGHDIDDILQAELSDEEVYEMNSKHMWSLYRLDVRLAILERHQQTMPLLCHASSQLPGLYVYSTLVLDEDTHESNIAGRTEMHQHISRMNLRDAATEGSRTVYSNQEMERAVAGSSMQDAWVRRAPSMCHMYIGNGAYLVTRSAPHRNHVAASFDLQVVSAVCDVPKGAMYFPICRPGGQVEGNEDGVRLVSTNDYADCLKQVRSMFNSLPSGQEPTWRISIQLAEDSRTCAFFYVKHIGAVINAGAMILAATETECLELEANEDPQASITLEATDDFRSMWSVLRWSGLHVGRRSDVETIVSCVMSGVARRCVRVKINDTILSRMFSKNAPIGIQGKPARSALAGAEQNRTQVAAVEYATGLYNIDAMLTKQAYIYGSLKQKPKSPNSYWTVPACGLVWVVSSRTIVEVDRWAIDSEMISNSNEHESAATSTSTAVMMPTLCGPLGVGSQSFLSYH